jgi:hypothetical protein
LLMAPALLVDIRPETLRRPRRGAFLWRVTLRARSTGAAAGASLLALPRPARVIFTDPATVLAE